MERVAVLLYSSGLGFEYWGEAVSTAVHQYNLTPHSGIDFQIPLVLFFENSLVTPNYKPDVSYLKPFGCLAFVHVPKEKRLKEAPHGIPGILVGYKKGSYSYLILIGKEIVVSAYHCTQFNESEFPLYKKKGSVVSILHQLQSDAGINRVEVVEIEEENIDNDPNFN